MGDQAMFLLDDSFKAQISNSERKKQIYAVFYNPHDITGMQQAGVKLSIAKNHYI